ncbi:MAG: hypothetical protein MR707_06730, partial [Galactobacillus timonensis]|uniref:hypothetical protein n=1 Tax=Galactobacillus timonensis TaxID=2041840 RepID=UPI0023EFE4F8
HNVAVVILNLLVCYVQRIYITRIRMAFSIFDISKMMLVYPQSCLKPLKKQRWVTRSTHQSADRTHKYITMDVMPVKPKILRPFAYAKEKEKPAYS